MKAFTKLLFLLLILSTITVAQYSGPAAGSKASGVTVNTNSFSVEGVSSPSRVKLFNHYKPELLPGRTPGVAPLGEEGSNVVMDPLFMGSENLTQDSVIVFESFNGIPETNSIPPDPDIAVGPNHVITVVNTSFRISDKEGNTLKTIVADNWFNSALNGADPFDPKVIYDHFENRWVMVWLHVDDPTSTSYYLISVSDDDDPIGSWNNWALPSNVNGNTPAGNWGDYQGVGYDDKGLYLTSNQFSFSSSFQYVKIRIIPKADIYAASPGAVTWNDLWNISYPNTSSSAFGLRPARMKTASPDGNYYFAVQGRFTVNTNIGVFTLRDPLGSPVLTSNSVSVTTYRSPSDPDQLGGGSPRIDGGGFNFRNEPVYQDGSLHIVHSVANGILSNVRYIEVDIPSMTAVRDLSLGTTKHYHTYPAIAVSEENDVLLTYSRSSGDEYMGAYFTILRNGSTTPVGSITLQEGKANYVKTFGGTRNRWGDYNGAYTDPADPSQFWVSTEYVANTNTWGVWVAGIRTIPYDDAFIAQDKELLDFEDIEASFESDEQKVVIKNYGVANLEISGITNSNSFFQITNSINFPVTLSAYDSLEVYVKFAPLGIGIQTDSLVVSSNDPDDPAIYIALAGNGYIISPAEDNKLYATVARQNSELIEINPSNAEGSLIGESEIADMESIVKNGENDELLALSSPNDMTDLVRINALGGDAYKALSFGVKFDAIAYDTNGTLYGIAEDRNIHEIDLVNGTSNIVSTSMVKVRAMAFDPTTNTLYASSDSTSSDDKIYTIEVGNGKATLVGNTGVGKLTTALAFTDDGDLYAIIWKLIQFSHLYEIDKATAAATEIGRVTGFNGIRGLVFSSGGVTFVKSDLPTTPTNFSLDQNYPNPFNPSTNFTFSLPVDSKVRLSIFNLLGQEVSVLFDQDLSSGVYSHEWRAVDNSGNQLSSGIYFYTLKAKGTDGSEFVQTKKMMFLK